MLAFTIVHAQVEPSANVEEKINTNTPVKTSIKVEDLMKNITKHISKNYKDYKPAEAYQIETKGVVSYEVIVEKESNKLDIYYDKDGKFLRKEVEKKAPVTKTATSKTKTVPKTNNATKSDSTKQVH
ncbi:MAG: hypothetical protein ABR968_07500 [Bacteroidales bacterium]|jgi:hypothetical protein